MAKTLDQNHQIVPSKAYLIELLKIYVLVFMSLYDCVPRRMGLNQVDDRFPHHQIVLG